MTSPFSYTALFCTLLLLAAIPSTSVLVVSTRSAAHGFMHGVFVTAGIIVGDLFFILLAIFGLTLLAESLGPWFPLIKIMGGAYLITIGISLWRTDKRSGVPGSRPEASRTGSFLSGLLITLGDQKAIFFYLGFFPAFFDLSALSLLESLLIAGIAIFAIAIAKLAYAFTAVRAGSSLRNKKARVLIPRAAGILLISIGILLIAGSGSVVPEWLFIHPHTFLKALALWAGILPFAILNGILRDKWLVNFLNPPSARRISGILLCVVIFAWSALTIPWLPPSRPGVYLGIGALWLLLTVGFEFGMGRCIEHRSWEELLRPYRFKDGDIWPLVLLVVTCAPLLAAWLRQLL